MKDIYLDPLGIPQPGRVRGDEVADRDVAAVGGALYVLPAPAVAVLREGSRSGKILYFKNQSLDCQTLLWENRNMV